MCLQAAADALLRRPFHGSTALGLNRLLFEPEEVTVDGPDCCSVVLPAEDPRAVHVRKVSASRGRAEPGAAAHGLVVSMPVMSILGSIVRLLVACRSWGTRTETRCGWGCSTRAGR